jgi:hypothetical protein
MSSDLQLQNFLVGLGDIIIRQLDSDMNRQWPREFDNHLACPFQRVDPQRYLNVKDFACTGYGFKDIADLRFVEP